MTSEDTKIDLCSQCGDRLSVVVKVGTTDGWCTLCLSEAIDSEQFDE